MHRLMGAYFHQDWELDGLDDRETVEAFIRESPGLSATLLAEIRAVLELDEADVERHLDSVGCEVKPSPTSNGSYRAWLAELAVYARNLMR